MIIYSDLHKTPFIIDDDDWEIVSYYRWSINNGYPSTNIKKGTKWVAITLHRFLLGPAGPGMEWDHKNLNRLDNRRENLQKLTIAGNRQNKSVYTSNTTSYPGITEINTRWRARVNIGGKRYHLGYFDSLEDAIRARQEAKLGASE